MLQHNGRGPHLEGRPNELWMEVRDIVQETGIKTIPRKKKCKKAKWLSEEALQIAVKRREAKCPMFLAGQKRGVRDVKPTPAECLLNHGQRFMTLYRRQGSRPSPWKRKAKKLRED